MSDVGKREWKPGDLAMVSTHVGDRRAMRDRCDGWTDIEGACWSDERPARPLVVIDPEDREQVEALCRCIADTGVAWDWERRSIANRERAVEGVAVALRTLANPVTKPEEPTGLGAVVEDADGEQWVRWSRDVDMKHAPWTRAEGGCDDAAYKDIAAVKVLSEGVTP